SAGERGESSCRLTSIRTDSNIVPRRPQPRLTNALQGPKEAHTPVRETRQYPFIRNSDPAHLTPSSKLLLRALLAACAIFVAVGVPSAPAAVKATPCWKALLNDWYDGRIDNIYPIPCYRQAIDHLPTDIRQYSNASDEIERALQAAIAH